MVPENTHTPPWRELEIPRGWGSEAKEIPQGTVKHFNAAFCSRYKILACKVQAYSESKISLSLLSFFSLFLSHFFSFAGHLVGFIFLVGKVFRKVFRVLRLYERNEGGGDFHGNFHVNVTRCFDFFPGVLD